MRQRQGFTLVELLVATALVLFIMVMLTQAFTVALAAFRQLKALGDMEERLRAASIILRRDLAADHFEGRRRLSDPNFWQLGPPREGYFRIQQGSISTVEGTDGDNIPSLYATNHALAFTVKLRGNNRGDFFSAFIGDLSSPLLQATFGQPDGRYQDTSSTYNSQWAEVVYFMVPNGSTAGGTPLFRLHRRQLLAVPADNNQVNVNWGTQQVSANPWPNPAYAGVSCAPNPQTPAVLYFNSPIDLTVPDRRFGMTPSPTPPNLPGSGGGALLWMPQPVGDGSDLLLTDVVSFDLQILLAGATDFIDVPANLFDSWSSVKDDTYDYSANTAQPLPAFHPGPPNQININAIQIILRIWDLKTQQTRQITIVQDM